MWTSYTSKSVVNASCDMAVNVGRCLPSDLHCISSLLSNGKIEEVVLLLERLV